MPTAPPYVWYVAYGSNLKLERFMAYLRGGVVEGSPRVHVGCDDPSPPTDDEAIDLRRRMFFAGQRSHWGEGGVAFLREAPVANKSTPWTGYGRRYRITGAQFEQVVAQENGQSRPPLLDWDQLRAQGALTLDGPGYADRRYRRLLLIEQDDDTHREPLCTFTAPPNDRATLGPPSTAYVRTIMQGIREMLPDLDPEMMIDYLLNAMFVLPDAANATSLRTFYETAEPSQKEAVTECRKHLRHMHDALSRND